MLRAIEDSISHSGGLRHFEKRKVRTVVRECGRKRRSRKLLSDLEEVMDAAGLHVWPELDDSGLNPDSWLRFSKQPAAERALGRSFKNERSMHEFIRDYHQLVFADTELANLEYEGSEIPIHLDLDEVRLDMLFRDSGGTAVVVEFKHEAPTPAVAAQLRRYMSALMSHEEAVRGVLLTNRPTSLAEERSIKKELELGGERFRIDWYWYSLSLPIRKATDL